MYKHLYNFVSIYALDCLRFLEMTYLFIYSVGLVKAGPRTSPYTLENTMASYANTPSFFHIFTPLSK